MCFKHIYGGIAQLGERSPHTREVTGSSPVVSTKIKALVFNAGAFFVCIYYIYGAIMGKPKRKKWNDFGFMHAINGIWVAFKTERNLKICALGAIAAIILAIWLSTSNVENALLAVTIGLVIAAELINTAIERAVDLSCEDILVRELKKDSVQPNAKLAKDIAAGAVLFTAVIALIVAAIIFIPKVIEKLS